MQLGWYFTTSCQAVIFSLYALMVSLIFNLNLFLVFLGILDNGHSFVSLCFHNPTCSRCSPYRGRYTILIEISLLMTTRWYLGYLNHLLLWGNMTVRVSNGPAGVDVTPKAFLHMTVFSFAPHNILPTKRSHHIDLVGKSFCLTFCYIKPHNQYFLKHCFISATKHE